MKRFTSIASAVALACPAMVVLPQVAIASDGQAHSASAQAEGEAKTKNRIGDVDGDGLDALPPANHNTTRSNRTSPQVSGDTGGADNDEDDDAASKDHYESFGSALDTVRQSRSAGSGGTSEVDVDGVFTSQRSSGANADGASTAAADYNSSRSNKHTSRASELNGDGEPEVQSESRATDYNSSRSNKRGAVDTDGDDDGNGGSRNPQSAKEIKSPQ